MKKTVRKFFIMMFAIASLISCSKEDDVYAPYGFVQSAYDIQGLWLSQQEYYTFKFQKPRKFHHKKWVYYVYLYV